MKRLIPLFLVAVVVVQFAEPAFAARRVRVVHHAPNRTTVVVHRGWPLRRPLPVVVVRTPRVAPRVVVGAYLAPVVFTAVAVSRPVPDRIVWQDSERFGKDEGWTDVILNADARGRKMFLEVVEGRVQADFAEIVFENGDARIVDFNQKTHGPGTYALLEFADGRSVDHVRLVARAKSAEAKVALLMEK